MGGGSNTGSAKNLGTRCGALVIMELFEHKFVKDLAARKKREIKAVMMWLVIIDDDANVPVRQYPLFCQWVASNRKSNYDHLMRRKAWRTKPTPLRRRLATCARAATIEEALMEAKNLRNQCFN